MYHMNDLQQKSRNFILSDFQKVFHNEEFLQLPATDVIEYISDDKLEVYNEDTVFESVTNPCSYVQAKKESHYACLPQWTSRYR
jgi:hypothetical protein